MQAGKRNRRVFIQRRQTGRLPSGQPTDEWVNTTSEPLWASIKAKSGLQTAASDTEVSSSRYSVRVNYRPSLDASMRVVRVDGAGRPILNDIYDIRAILHDEENRGYTDLVCETRWGDA